MNSITTLVRQIESTYERLSHLCLQAKDATTPTLEILPQALKELGPTAEALQMVTQTLHQQSQDNPQIRFGCNLQAQMLTNLEGKIQAVNSATAQLLRMPAADLVGQYVSRFVAIDQRRQFHLELKQLQESAQPQEWVNDLQPRRSKLLELILSVAPVPNSDDEPVQLHWTLQNAAGLRALLVESALKHERGIQSQPSTTTAELQGLADYCFEAGEVIPLNLQTVWYVHQGVVRLSTLTANNEEVVLGWVGAAMPFTASSAALLTYQAIALTRVRLAKLPLRDIQSDCNLAQLLLPKLHDRLQQAEALLNVAGQRRTEDRLYALLQVLQREFGEPIASGEKRICVRFTHENLANACCTTRVTVTRILSKFQQEKKLRLDHKNYIILNDKF